MIRIVGDTFCDIIASGMDGLPKVGGDVLAHISLVAGGWVELLFRMIKSAHLMVRHSQVWTQQRSARRQLL